MNLIICATILLKKKVEVNNDIFTVRKLVIYVGKTDPILVEDFFSEKFRVFLTAVHST